MGQREAIRAIRALGNALEHMTRGSDQRIELELALFSLSEPPQQVAVQAVPCRPACRSLPTGGPQTVCVCTGQAFCKCTGGIGSRAGTFCGTGADAAV